MLMTGSELHESLLCKAKLQADSLIMCVFYTNSWPIDLNATAYTTHTVFQSGIPPAGYHTMSQSTYHLKMLPGMLQPRQQSALNEMKQGLQH